MNDGFEPRAFLRTLFDAAVEAASPVKAVPPALPPHPKGRTLVIGAGKAAAAMAAAVEAHWDGPLEGLVITRYGHRAPTRRIEVVEAGHPQPDSAGEAATRRMLDLVSGLTADDLVLCLISGGGSALAAAPAPGVRLQDKIAINKALLTSGASIAEMNAVRKHLSAIKGGRLAVAAAPAEVVGLVISDAPGDDLSVIASGPTAPDPTTRQDALAILRRYRIETPPAVAEYLSRAEAETPNPGRPEFARVSHRLIATPGASLEAAARVAAAAGVAPVVLGDAIEGEAREAARVLGGIALAAKRSGRPARPPCVLLSGGETTVTVRGRGRGGRNAEFLLGLALALDGAPGVWALAADTDGVDGSEDNAGAFIGPDTLARAARLERSARAFLEDNDAYAFFSRLDDLLRTGPTLTNVNDFRAMLVT